MSRMANPKGLDGYGPSEKSEPEYGTVAGFNIKIQFTPSGRDWEMTIGVPEYLKSYNMERKIRVL